MKIGETSVSSINSLSFDSKSYIFFNRNRSFFAENAVNISRKGMSRSQYSRNIFQQSLLLPDIFILFYKPSKPVSNHVKTIPILATHLNTNRSFSSAVILHIYIVVIVYFDRPTCAAVPY
jgi:hypothetical protein